MATRCASIMIIRWNCPTERSLGRLSVVCSAGPAILQLATLTMTLLASKPWRQIFDGIN
jgi:hypothetical protein